MHFISLDEIAHRDATAAAQRRLYGGKALNLATLIGAGFCVPAGFVISTDVFQAEMHRNICERPGEDVVCIAESAIFSKSFEKALRRALAETPGRTWAVRSSSTDEDSRQNSMAGMQESVIGVSSYDDCLAAVRRVWASFYARERLLYPSNADLTGEVPAMAVVIQGFVDSESAGVVFTHHPFVGSRCMLVNVSHGQGAAVVDGKAGESITVDRYHAQKDVASECLTPEQIRELVRVAADIESTFGRAQDIEFSFAQGQLFILQARDIVKREREKNTIYSNVNVGEALSGVCTPMTWSVGMMFAKRGFDTIFSTFGLTAPEGYSYVSTFYGHIYLNISEILSVASQVPFIDASTLAKIGGVKSIDDYITMIEPISARHFVHHLPRSMARLCSMQRQLRHIKEREIAFCRHRDELRSFDTRHCSKRELYEAFAKLDDVFFDCGNDMLVAGASFLASYVLCSLFLNKCHAASDESLESYLFSGLLDVRSAEPGFALLNMSNEIRKHRDLSDAFVAMLWQNDVAAFRAQTESLDGGADFWRDFDAFIQAYGARANQEAELANARWCEDPTFLFQVITTHITACVAPNAKAQKAQVDEAANERQLRTDEIGSTLPFALRPIFKNLLHWAQKNARLREKWRAYVVDVLGLYRSFLRQTAQRMVEDGTIYAVDDVFYLTYEELKSWFSSPANLRYARLFVAFRRARHQAYMSARALPDTFVTHPNRCNEEKCPAGSRILYGLPASPGCVHSRVRVLESLQDAGDLQYGEILVTRSTDVGWTPLFLVASAILTERGGPLSHAFVVAREYGVPAVVAIPNVTQILKTGDVVTVSGQKGFVAVE